jgi:hypothetical protein
MATPEKGTVPSAARRLTELEAAQVATTARGLPPGWVVAVEAPHGQLSLKLRGDVPRSALCWVADAELGTIYRLGWLDASCRRP